MDDSDKPLGAPHAAADEDKPSEETKSRRKLNWKGFFIAIVVVVLIQWYAITTLNSEDPQIAPPTTPTSIQPSQIPSPYPSVNPTANITQDPNQQTACTQDAKECPDGTWVGRSGPNCEFVCPGQ